MGCNSALKGLKSSTYFEHYRAQLQEVYVVIVIMQPLKMSKAMLETFRGF